MLFGDAAPGALSDGGRAAGLAASADGAPWAGAMQEDEEAGLPGGGGAPASPAAAAAAAAARQKRQRRQGAAGGQAEREARGGGGGGGGGGSPAGVRARGDAPGAALAAVQMPPMPSLGG
jgi:hypothetical protein